MKTFKPKLQNFILSSFLAFTIVSAPLVSFAHENEQNENKGGKVKVEQHEKIKLSKDSKSHSFWNWNRMSDWFNKYKKDGVHVILTKPVIADLAATSSKPNKATIKWTTNINSSSLVWYSLTSPVDTSGNSKTARHFFGGKNHIVNLKKLEPGTKYYVIVGSGNKAGKTLSSEISFTTPAVVTPTNIIPVIAPRANITIGATSSAGAVVTYTSPNVTDDMDATTTATCSPVSGSTFAIGTTTVYCNHTDSGGNHAVQTSFNVVVTTDTTNPVITNVSSNTGSSSSTITWTTNEQTTSKVYYSTITPVNLNTSSSVIDATLSTPHSLNISGLSTSTLYYFVVESKDASGNTTVSNELSFTTSS